MAEVLYHRRQIQLVRAIPDDERLMQRLLRELRLRGIDPSYRRDGTAQHIALISEWDSDYGRALPKADKTWVHRFSYLRGLDGLLPKAAPAPLPAPRPKIDPTRPGDQERRERAELSGQFDYLERLADRIQNTDGPARS